MRTPSLIERQKAAADAKRAAVERYQAKVNDPNFADRQAARQAVVAAREIRVAERRTAEEARRAREAAEEAARDEAQRAAQEAAVEAERAAHEKALEAERAARQAAADAKAAREHALQETLLNTRKERKAARKAKKRSGKK